MLPYERYLETVSAIWTGKFIGGTIGAPMEGYKQLLSFELENSIPDLAVENDDTDLQILWLHALQEHGVGLTARDLMREWLEHFDAPWNEYGVAFANWQRGIEPPESGKVDNWFWGNGMGSPIRSEIWASICPGSPELAARYAAMDSSLDHVEDSVEAEKFLAALEAMLFVEKDLVTLIRGAAEYVDEKSRLSYLIFDVLEWCSLHDWQEVRTLVLRKYYHPDMTHVLQNVGFILLSLMKCEKDFSRAVEISIRCGYDTDCTAATTCAILAPILGLNRIDSRLLASVNDEYIVSDCLKGFKKRGSMSVLVREFARLAVEVAEEFETGLQFQGYEKEAPMALGVTEVDSKPIFAPLKPFPDWLILGPFLSDARERFDQDKEYPDHGNPSLPSAHYLSHMATGFERDFIDIDLVFKEGRKHIISLDGVRGGKSKDSRVVLGDEGFGEGPATYFAYTECTSVRAEKIWILAGSECPIKVWFNGRLIINSDGYQKLTPNTHAVEASLHVGNNRFLLQLSGSFWPARACLAIKHHPGQHWHQCYYIADLEWMSL